jgi:dTDP-4-dehydrorhamnose 3,5-epimerase
MKLTKTIIEGLYIIEQNISKDNRGSFVKNFTSSEFLDYGIECDFKESYYTESKEDVIRGMHFQVPPYDHSKLITVISGAIIDVVLDLRIKSKTYGKYFFIELSRENRKSLSIPRGLAHGFGVLSEHAIAYYQVSSEYNKEFDKGIAYNSFGMKWPIDNPILSERDISLPLFKEFKSPF